VPPRLVASLCIALSLVPSTGSLAHAQAGQPAATDLAADLDLLIETLRRTHPQLERSHPRADWDAAVADVRGRLEGMALDRFTLEVARIVALAGDGHSRAEVEQTAVWQQTLPVRFRRFDDGLFVVAAAPSCRELAGRRVVRIGAREIAPLLQEMRVFVSADNVEAADELVPLPLITRAALEACGAAAATGSVEIATVSADTKSDTGSDGATTVTKVDANVAGGPPFGAPADWTKVAPPEKGTPSLRPRSLANPYWFEPLDGEPAVYVRFDAVMDAGKETLAAFVERLFRFLDESESERLILDLRGNDGGNNYLNQPLIHAVIRSARIDRPGHLFVLTSPFTFSAAVNCASDLERETFALFVGAPTGAGANHCGDAKEFVLPKTRIPVRCSTLRWQKSDPSDVRRKIAPDVPVATTFADWSAGRDAALEAVLAFDPADAADFAKIPPIAHWRRPSQTPRR
jgi:hypothetical protein